MCARTHADYSVLGSPAGGAVACCSLSGAVEQKREISFLSFSGMNNIPGGGERTYQEANGKRREIAAAVTDKSVAELVLLTAP